MGDMELEVGGKFVATIIFLILLVLGIFLSAYTIEAGERGVLLTWGKPSMDAVKEGLHFKIPLAQTVKKVDVRVQKVETTADSVTKDLQQVMTNVALNYHVDAGSAPRLYQEVGTEYAERIINPALQESVKAITAKYEIEELTDKRPQIGREIGEMLTRRLSKYNLIVDDFSVINFDWSAEFKQSIEDKLTAEQKKLKAEMDLERVKIEAQQEIEEARAEAEALRLQKQEVTPELLELRKIEANILAIQQWDGRLPKITGGAMPFVDVALTEESKSEN